jgi:tetratricopeptide (TPR) repeat protein
MAVVKGSLGSLDLELEDYISAKRFCEEAYEYFQKSTHLNERIACLQNLGLIALQLGDEEQAVDYILNGLRMAMQLQDEDQFVNLIQILLEYYEKDRKYDMVRELKQKALEFWEAMKLEGRQYKTLIDLGVLSQILDQYEEALQYFKKAYNLAYSMNDSNKMYLAEGFIGETYFKLNEIEKASESYSKAFMLAVFLQLPEEIDKMRAVLLTMGFSVEEIKQKAENAKEGIPIASKQSKKKKIPMN